MSLRTLLVAAALVWFNILQLCHAFSFFSTWGVNKPLRMTDAARTHQDLAATVDVVQEVQEYTRDCIKLRGTRAGLRALESLGELCSARTSFDFAKERHDKGIKGSIMTRQRKLLPLEVTESFLQQVHEMESNGWLSTNPDSVDSKPSLHLNLVSGGKRLFESDSSNHDKDFQQGIEKLLEIVEPHIYQQLLPKVRQEMGSDNIAVSDVFLRRYGEDIVGASRKGISAHYDVFSKVTAVIAMDNTAADGTNGLYTTALGEKGETSNHAGLRRFFPLEQGDGAVHTWDVLHGVDVQPGVDRTSLIVWFSTKEALLNSEQDAKGKSISPWLTGHPNLETSDVAQFVLASALESAQPEACNHHPHDLYLSSASRDNAFALSRLGALCEEQSLSQSRLVQAMDVLDTFHNAEELPFLSSTNVYTSLSRRFWYEGTIRGNPLSQVALGDDLMAEAALTDSEDMRILAATCFGLAAQQGSEEAMESLSRVVEFETAAKSIASQDKFDSLPVVQLARVAMLSS